MKNLILGLMILSSISTLSHAQTEAADISEVYAAIKRVEDYNKAKCEPFSISYDQYTTKKNLRVNCKKGDEKIHIKMKLYYVQHDTPAKFVVLDFHTF